MTIRSGLRVLGIDKEAARVTINGEVVKVGEEAEEVASWSTARSPRWTGGRSATGVQ